MSSANPVIVAGANANPIPTFANPNANPVAKPSLGARIKTVAESVWAVVKPILLILAIAAGATACAALLGFVTVALSPAIFWAAVGVGAVALLYVFYKGCQKASLTLDKRAFRKEVAQFKIAHPAIALQIQDLHTRGFDRSSIHALIKLHKVNEHLKADPNKNQSQSFAEICKKVTAHLDGELNKNYQPPALTIPDYCQTEQAIIAYVTNAAEKRDTLITSISNITTEKAVPARINQAVFLAIADKVVQNIETTLAKLDKDLPDYLQVSGQQFDIYASIPNYCHKPQDIVSYIEKIVEQRELVDKAITMLDGELNKKMQEPVNHKAWIKLGNEILNMLKEKKSHLDQGRMVTIPEFFLEKDLLEEISNLSKDKDASIELLNKVLQNRNLLKKSIKSISVITSEIQKKMNKGNEDTRLVAAAKKVAATAERLLEQLKVDYHTTVPGFCLFTGNDYLTNVTAIANKQERLERALTYIKTTGGVDAKVKTFFENALFKIQKGINVPLPDYYHATTAMNAIIQSNHIRQSSGGYMGTGTYVSNNNEGHCGYGPYAFAIDEGVFVDTAATTFRGNCRSTCYKGYSPMWAAVLKNIPIAQDTIAFIDTNKGDIPVVQQLLQSQNLYIEVIDRTTSDEIRLIFDQTTASREIPSFGWQGSGLPANMRFRAV